jgi:nicotinamide mononucleotide (NMN) deamidase PncC
MNIPLFEDLLPDNNNIKIINKLKYISQKSAFDLLVLMNSKSNEKKYLQIATSESLTAGLIMSTLVDIPWGGYLKYGCFGVYDTDAKRVFNGVNVDDIYTNKCAAEMAIGVLKNSNATLAISVTGNAMPYNEQAERLGEVFIGVAGYDYNNNIIYITKSINSCIDSNYLEFKQTCSKWFNTIIKDPTLKTYNSRSDTASISQEIRYYTTYKALETCIEFIYKFDPIVPDEILERKRFNEMKINNIHVNIPQNKFNFGGIGICKNENYCDTTGIRNGFNTNIIPKNYLVNSIPIYTLTNSIPRYTLNNHKLPKTSRRKSSRKSIKRKLILKTRRKSRGKTRRKTKRK